MVVLELVCRVIGCPVEAEHWLRLLRKLYGTRETNPKILGTPKYADMDNIT